MIGAELIMVWEESGYVRSRYGTHVGSQISGLESSEVAFFGSILNQ